MAPFSANQPAAHPHQKHSSDGTADGVPEKYQSECRRITDQMRDLIGIDDSGTEVEGRTRDNAAFIAALSQVTAQGTMHYRVLMADAEAAEVALTAFSGMKIWDIGTS